MYHHVAWEAKMLTDLITLTIATTICFIGLLNCFFVQLDILIVDEWNGPPEWNCECRILAKCASK